MIPSGGGVTLTAEAASGATPADSFPLSLALRGVFGCRAAELKRRYCDQIGAQISLSLARPLMDPPYPVPQILRSLSSQGLTSSGGDSVVGGDGSNSNRVSRAAIKERFKSFNMQFEELHQGQSQ